MATTTTTTTLAPGDEEDTGNASLILVASFAAAMVVVGFGSIIAICKYCEHRTSKAGRDAQRKALEKQTQQIKNAEMKRAAKIAKKKKEKDKEIIRELKKMGFTYDESALLIAQGNAQYFLDGPPEGDFDLPSIRKKRNKSNEVPIEPEMEVDDELEGVGDKARRDSWDPFAGLDDESEVIGERLRNKRTSRRTSNVKDAAAATATSLFDDDTNSNSSKDSRVSITSGELEDPSDLIDDEPTVLCSLAGGKGAGGEQGDSDEGEDEREVEKEIIFDYTDSDEDDIYRRQQEKIRTSRRAPFMLNTRRALPKEDPFDTWDQLDAVLTNKEQQKKAALARRKKEEDAVLWEENRIRRRIAIVTKKPVAIDFEL